VTDPEPCSQHNPKEILRESRSSNNARERLASIVSSFYTGLTTFARSPSARMGGVPAKETTGNAKVHSFGGPQLVRTKSPSLVAQCGKPEGRKEKTFEAYRVGGSPGDSPGTVQFGIWADHLENWRKALGYRQKDPLLGPTKDLGTRNRASS